MMNTIVFKQIAYKDDAYIERDRDGIVDNHEELVRQGKTYYQIRALPDNKTNQGHIPDTHIIEPGDPLWRDRYRYLHPGEYVRIDC